jgi:hypothetical protein
LQIAFSHSATPPSVNTPTLLLKSASASFAPVDCATMYAADTEETQSQQFRGNHHCFDYEDCRIQLKEVTFIVVGIFLIRRSDK